MTQNEIIEMAKQAGIVNPQNVLNVLEAFAKLIAQHEREACAKVCEECADDSRTGANCAKIIRARGSHD